MFNTLKNAGIEKDRIAKRKNEFKKQEALADKNNKFSKLKNLFLSGALGIAITLNVLNGCGRTDMICVEGVDCSVVENKTDNKKANIPSKDVKTGDNEDIKPADTKDAGEKDDNNDIPNDGEIQNDVGDVEVKDKGIEDAADTGEKDAGVDDLEDVSQTDANEQDSSQGDGELKDDGSLSEEDVGDVSFDIAKDGVQEDPINDSGYNDISGDSQPEDNGQITDVSSCIEKEYEIKELKGGNILTHSNFDIKNTENNELWQFTYWIYRVRQYCTNGNETPVSSLIGVNHEFYTGNSQKGNYIKCISVKPEYNIGYLNIEGILYDLHESNNWQIVIYPSLPTFNKDLRCETINRYLVLTPYHKNDMCTGNALNYIVPLYWANRNTIFYDFARGSISVSYAGWMLDGHKLIIRQSNDSRQITVKAPNVYNQCNQDTCISFKIKKEYTNGVDVSPLDNKVTLSDGMELTLNNFDSERKPTVIPVTVISKIFVDENGNLCGISLYYNNK